MNNEKLKPCPFCGGCAGFRYRLCSDGMTQMKVVCKVCDAESPHGLVSMDEFISDSDYFDACRIAAERWNKRAE